MVWLYTLLFLWIFGSHHTAGAFVQDCDEYENLELSLSSPSNTFEVGQPISLHLKFRNKGSEPIYIEYSGTTFGPSALNIIAQKDGETYTIGSAHFDREISDLRLDYKPLSPGEVFETQINGINDPSSANILRLPISSPGVYKLFVQFRSQGQNIEGVIWPIWRGCLRSNIIKIVLTKSSENKLSNWRNQLRQCLKTDTCDNIQAIAYFQIVRDAEAADLLVKLITKYSTDYLLSELAQAIANQGRGEDAALLLQLASRPGLEISTANYLRLLAGRLSKPTN